MITWFVKSNLSFLLFWSVLFDVFGQPNSRLIFLISFKQQQHKKSSPTMVTYLGKCSLALLSDRGRFLKLDLKQETQK